MIPFLRAKELFEIFNQHVDTGQPFTDKELNDVFVPHLWKNDVVSSQSWLGRIFRVISLHKKPPEQALRVHRVFSEVLKTLSQSSRDDTISEAHLLRLHRFVKAETWAPGAVTKQAAALTGFTEMQEASKKKKLEQESAMRSRSLLHVQPVSRRKIDVKIFEEIFHPSSDAILDPVKQAFLKYLGRHPLYAKSHIKGLVKRIESGQAKRKEQQEKVIPNGQKLDWERYQAVCKEMADKMAKEIQALPKGKQSLYCGSYGKMGAPFAQLVKILSRVSPELLKQYPTELVAFLQAGRLPPPEQYLDGFLKQMDGAQAVLPELTALVGSHPISHLLPDSSRHLPESVSAVLPEWIAKHVESWQRQGIIGNLMEFVQDGDFRECVLEGVALGTEFQTQEQAQRVYERMKARLQTYSVEQLQSMQGEVERALNLQAEKMLSALQSMIPGPLQSLLGVDCLSMRGAFWLEYTHEQDGSYTVEIHATGPALTHHRREGEKIEWPLRIQGVQVDRLNEDFFRHILFHQFVAEYDSEASIHVDALYQGLIEYLGGTIAEKPTTLRVLDPTVYSPWQVMQTLCIKPELSLDLVNFGWHKECLLDFCQPRLREGKLLFTTEQECRAAESALTVLSTEMERIGIGLDPTEVEQVRNTLQEVQLAIDEARHQFFLQSSATPSVAPIIPQEVLDAVRKMFLQLGMTREPLDSVKEILIWCLGDEMGELVEALLPNNILEVSILEVSSSALKPMSLSELSTEASKEATKRLVTTRPKGWLRTILFHSYTHVAIQVFKYAILLSRSYSVGLIFALKSYVAKGARYIIPQEIQDWYAAVMAALERKMRDLVVQLILRVMMRFSAKETQNLQTVIQQWQESAKKYARVVLEKDEVSYVLDKPIENLSKTTQVTKKIPLSTVKIFQTQKEKDEIATQSIEDRVVFSKEYGSDPISHTNVLRVMWGWDAGWKSIAMQDNSLLYQIQQQIFRLPVPKIGEEDIWDRIPKEEITPCVAALLNLTDILQKQTTNYLAHSKELPLLRGESIVLAYSLLAITEKLAKRDESTHLAGFKVNGYPLLHWFQSNESELANPLYLRKLKDVCNYLMPGIDIYDLPTQEQLKKRAEGTLFNYNYDSLTGVLDTHLPEYRYLQQRLKDPVVQGKLVERGISKAVAKKAAERDLIGLLFTESHYFDSQPIFSRIYQMLRLQTMCCKTMADGSRWNDVFPKKGETRSPLKYQLNTNRSWWGKLTHERFGKIVLPEQFEGAINYKRYLGGHASRFKGHLIKLPISQDVSLEPTQSSVMSTSSLGERSQKLIQVESVDEFMRALGDLRTHPEIFQKGIDRLELYFFHAGRLSKQLRQSPQVAAEIGKVFSETIEYLDVRKQEVLVQKMVLLGMQVKKYCAHFVDQEMVNTFPDFTTLIRERMGEGKNLASLRQWRQLYALSINGSSESMDDAAKKEVIRALLLGMFSSKGEKKPSVPLIDAEFILMYSDWLPKILEAGRDRSNCEFFFREILKQHGLILPDREHSKLFPTIARCYGFQSGSHFSTYKYLRWDLDPFSLDLQTGSILNLKDGRDASSFIKKMKTRLLEVGESEQNFRSLLFGQWESESGNVRVVYKENVKIDEQDPERTQVEELWEIKKKINGTWCSWVSPSQGQTDILAIVDGSNGWLSEPDERGARKLYIYSQGALVKSFGAKGTPEEGYALEEIVEGPELVRVDAEQLLHGFRSLTKFCPLSKIDCYGMVGQNSIQKVTFSPYDLSFTVKLDPTSQEGAPTFRAENADLFPGYAIAKKQASPDLRGISSYLLLENAQGQKKVLIPAGQWLPSFVGSMLSRLGNFAHLVSPALFEKLHQAGTKKYYVFDLEEGQLVSKDHEASAYLLNLYLLSGNREKAERACVAWEMLSKQLPMGQISREPMWALVLVTLVFPWAKSIRHRILAAWEENRLVQIQPKAGPSSQKEKASEAIQEDLFWGMVTYVDLMDVQTETDPSMQLTDDQEWFLFQKYLQHSQGLLQHLMQQVQTTGEKSSWFKKQLSQLNWESIGVVSMPERVRERYAALSKKYGRPISGVVDMGSQLLRFFQTESSVPVAPPVVAQILPGTLLSTTLLKTEESSLSTVVKQGLHLWKGASAKISHEKLFDSMLSELHREAPLTYDTITPEIVKKYFLSYYAIARQEPEILLSRQKKTALVEGQERDDESIPPSKQLQQLHKKLTDTLCLLQNGAAQTWSESDRAYVEYLLTICRNPNVFEDTIELLKAKREAPRIDRQGTPYKRLENKQPKFQKFLDGIQRRVWMIHAERPLSFLCKKTARFILDRTCPGVPIRDAWATVQYASKFFNYLTAKPSAPPARPLPGADPRLESLASLGREDTQFDRMFDELFGMALEVASPSRSDTRSLFDEGREEIPVEESEALIQKSVRAYQDLPGRLPEYLRLKDPKILWGLYLDLGKIRDVVKTELEQGKKDLLSFANQGRKGPEVTFEDLTRFFLTGVVDKTKLSHIAPEQLQKLDGLIGQFLVKETRFQQMQRAIDQLEGIFRLDPKTHRLDYEHGIEQLATTLKTRRTYSFETLPPRLARTLLLFEHGSHTLLWKKQSSRIIDVLLGEQADVVFELIMSLGKTSTIIPVISQYIADGTNLVFNIWPKAIAETNISQISQQNKKIFHQTMNAIRFSRDMAFTIHNLQALYALFQRAIEKRETINLTKEDAQALELLLIDCLEKCESGSVADVSKTEELVNGASKLLLLIRTRGKFMGDEAHELLSGKQELNYPIGPSSTIGAPIFDAIDACMQAFTQDEEVSGDIRKDQLHHISSEKYVRVQKGLAFRMSEYARFQVRDEQREEFVAYVSGALKKVPKWIQESKRYTEISMVKGVISILLPSILQGACSVNYGFHPEGDKSAGSKPSEFALPFEGNSSPVESATIRNPHEALVKTYVMYFLQGLQPAQTQKLLDVLRKQAYDEIQSSRNRLQDTEAYQQLVAWFPPESGIDFTAVFQGKASADTQKVLDGMRHHPDAARMYIREVVWKQIVYWKKNARNNAHNFSSMAKSQYYDTGTPYNYGEYPANLKVLWDPGTIGEALHIVSKKCPKDGVQLLTKTQPKEVVDEVLEKYFQSGSDFTAIIDGGAQFRGLDNLTVAKRMMDFVMKTRPDIEAIDFFVKDELMSLVRGSSKPVPHKLCKVPLAKRLSYFDQCHGFGANIPQKFNGKGLLLIGEQHCLYRLLQELFRMRGVKIFKKLLSKTALTPEDLQKEDLTQTQTVHFAMTPQVQKKISPEGAPITLRDIVRFATKNEIELVKMQNYQGYRSKILNIVRRAVLDKILRATDIRQKREIFRAFKDADLLISRVEDDPKKLYGLIERWVDTEEVLKSMQKGALKLLENRDCFTHEECERLQKEMEAIDKPVMPDQVRVFESKDGMQTGVLEDLDKQVSVHQDQDVSTEQETEQEAEQETEMETQAQGQLPKVGFTETPWATTLNPVSKSWLTFTQPVAKMASLLGYGLNQFFTVTRLVKSKLTPPLFRLVDVLESSSRELFQRSSKFFDSRIWMTNNFLPRILSRPSESVVEVGSDQQRDLFQVLIHVKEEAGKLKITSVGCLSQADAAAWRKILRNPPTKEEGTDSSSSKVLLYDTQVQAEVLTSGVDIEQLKKTKDWLLLEVQLKFLNGDVRYSAEQVPVLREWVQASGVEQMRELFYAIHHQRGRHPIRRSTIDKILRV